MEPIPYKDEVKFSRGFIPGVPLEEADAVGDAMRDGKNVALTPYARPIAWPGLSRVRKVAGKLLQIVGEKLASIGSGNVVLNYNNTVWFVGSGDTFVDDPATPIGTASSQLQVKVGNQVYQAGLPAPPAPTLEQAVDATLAPISGVLTGTVAATVTRVRTATGSAIAPGESPESPTSAAMEFKNGKARVRFDRALTAIGQDAWGLYFTKPTLGGAGRRQLLRYVYETELADPVSASLGIAAGDGATTNFQATTASAVNSRNVAVAVASSGASAPTSRGTNSFAVTGVSATVARITGMLDGEYQLVGLQIKQVHGVQNHEMNHGTLAPTITGAITILGGLLNDITQIQLEILNSTQFRWKRETDSVWDTLALAATPTALGTTGLYVTWSAAAATIDEQSNKYFVTPFGVGPPTGWTAIKMQGSSADTFVNIVYGKLVSASETDYTWSFGASVQVNVITVGLTGNHGTPVASSAASAAMAATTHTIIFAGALATSDAVVCFFGSETPNAFTLVAPLTLATEADLDTRFVDVDFTSDDLLDIFPPKSEEVDAPPAATHVVPLGQYMVLLGTLDGTGITPSLPGRYELYSIASTTYLTPREPLLRVDVRPQDGMVFLWTRSSVQTLLEGDNDTPVIPRGLISNRGIANPNAAVVTDAGAYAYDTEGGLYFISNYRELNTMFITAVETLLKTFRPDETVLGYDLNRRALHVCDGRKMLVYYEKEQAWSSLMYADDFLHQATENLPDVRITSAVTFDGKLYLSIGNDALGYQAYEVGKGIGTDWFVQSAPRYAGYQRYEKTIRKARLFANFDSSTALDWHTGINAVASMGLLRGTGGNGSIIGDVIIPLRQAAAGGIAWEFACVAGRDGSAYLLSDYTNLFTSINATTALLAFSFTSTSIVIKKNGVTQGYAPMLQTGDVLRLEFQADLTWLISQTRAGVAVSSQNIGALAVAPTSLGVKALLVDANARLDFGKVMKSAPAGGYRLYREFETTPLLGRTFAAAGEKYYPWKRMDYRRVISYRAEIYGNGVGQFPFSLLVNSTVIPIEKTSP